MSDSTVYVFVFYSPVFCMTNPVTDPGEPAEVHAAGVRPFCLRSKIVAGLVALGVLVVALAARWLLVSSPLHMDEYNYLFVGRLFHLGESWPTLTYIFGADFNWRLLGWAYSISNTPESARFIAAVAGLFSLIAVYMMVYVVWKSRLRAIVTIMLFALMAPHIYISSLATYDIVAFCLFCWGMVFLWSLMLSEPIPKFVSDIDDISLISSMRRRSRILLICTAVLIVAAVLSKYVLILYLPCLLFVVLLYKPRYALPAMLMVGGLLSIYAWQARESLMVLYQTQILITQSANINRFELFKRFSYLLCWTVVLLAFVNILNFGLRRIPAWRSLLADSMGGSNITESLKPKFLFLMLALPLPVYHLASSNQIASIKHLNYFYLFALPLVACAIVDIAKGARAYLHQAKSAENRPWLGLSSVSLVLVVVGGLAAQLVVSNLRIAADLSKGFPDISAAADYWQKSRLDKNNSGRILSEDPYLFRFAALPDFPQALISETTFLDNNQDGEYTSQDVKDAIWDHKFKWVLLTDQIHPQENRLYRRLLLLRGYEAVVRQPYSLTPLLTGNRNGVVELYQLRNNVLADAN